jgi:hypothetical protein
VNPPASQAEDTRSANTRGSSKTPVFGQQYSSYPNSSTATVAAAEKAGAAAAANTTATTAGKAGQQQQRQQQQRQYDFDFNYVSASDDAAARSLFRGELDGERFAPMRMGESGTADIYQRRASCTCKWEDDANIMHMFTAATC